jgi:hypothetical protein
MAFAPRLFYNSSRYAQWIGNIMILKNKLPFFFASFSIGFLFLAGCTGTFPAVKEMEDLALISNQDESFVRLYGSTWFFPEVNAIHTWFLTRSENSREINRWEVSVYRNPAAGFVWRNLDGPIVDYGGGVSLIAELTGPDARPVIDFLENRLEEYPYKDTFYLWGPNCNTFAQWVLNQTGWNVVLPESALGKDFLVAP